MCGRITVRNSIKAVSRHRIVSFILLANAGERTNKVNLYQQSYDLNNKRKRTIKINITLKKHNEEMNKEKRQRKKERKKE